MKLCLLSPSIGEIFKISAFAPSVKFLTPRYVLCIPDQKVAVMDEKALYIIRQNDGKLHTVMFKKETHR